MKWWRITPGSGLRDASKKLLEDLEAYCHQNSSQLCPLRPFPILGGLTLSQDFALVRIKRQDPAPGSIIVIKDQDRLQSLPFCHPVTLSYNKIISCHLVIVTSCHLFIMTSCHLVIVASCHLVISDSKIVVLTQTEPRAAF